MKRLALALVCAALPVTAQEAAQAPGAVLRALDKISGETTDIDLPSGQSRGYGRLIITLGECRHPSGGSVSEAYAYLTIADAGVSDAPVFQGWMLANSPALNALDHPRYDVWVLRCMSS